MGDFLWDIATSDLALAIVGCVALAGFVVAHVPLIRNIPAVAPYVLLAGLVYHLALADFALCVGFRIADERAEAKSLRAQIEANHIDIETANAAAKQADAARAELVKQSEQDQERIADYEERLRHRAPKDGDKSTCGCTLVPDDFDGLRHNGKPAR